MIREFLDHGYDVLSLDRVPPSQRLCPSWIVDLKKIGDLYEALKDAHGVVHLGAYAMPGLAPDSEVFTNNVTATYHVLKAASDRAVMKVVLVSSSAAFGLTTRPAPGFLNTFRWTKIILAVPRIPTVFQSSSAKKPPTRLLLQMT